MIIYINLFIYYKNVFIKRHIPTDLSTKTNFIYQTYYRIPYQWFYTVLL